MTSFAPNGRVEDDEKSACESKWASGKHQSMDNRWFHSKWAKMRYLCFFESNSVQCTIIGIASIKEFEPEQKLKSPKSSSVAQPGRLLARRTCYYELFTRTWGKMNANDLGFITKLFWSQHPHNQTTPTHFTSTLTLNEVRSNPSALSRSYLNYYGFTEAATILWRPSINLKNHFKNTSVNTTTV